MSKNTIDPRTSVLIIMILLAAVFRVLQASDTFSIFTNLTPAGAMALFGGTYFRNRWKAMLIPVVAMWISDIFINRLLYFDHWVFFYSGSWMVYGTFALMAVIGFFISKVNLTTVAVAGVSAAKRCAIAVLRSPKSGSRSSVTSCVPRQHASSRSAS